MPITLPVDALFSIANTLALVSWVGLIVLPRWRFVRRALQLFIVAGLCVLYAMLIQGFFFGVEGGGFFSLAAVQKLFTSREVALAGWVHYLAFDLFVGLWIAGRADEIGISRWVQGPILLMTFMFGPIGLLMFAATLGLRFAFGRLSDATGWRSA